MSSDLELAKGWLQRQLENVERDFATWPQWMKQTAGISAAQPSAEVDEIVCDIERLLTDHIEDSDNGTMYWTKEGAEKCAAILRPCFTEGPQLWVRCHSCDTLLMYERSKPNEIEIYHNCPGKPAAPSAPSPAPVNPYGDGRMRCVECQDAEWKILSRESQEKISKWFELATKFLQQILDESPAPAAPEGAALPDFDALINRHSLQHKNFSIGATEYLVFCKGDAIAFAKDYADQCAVTEVRELRAKLDIAETGLSKLNDLYLAAEAALKTARELASLADRCWMPETDEVKTELKRLLAALALQEPQP